MISIRNNVFETNSSSTHSITMCSKEEYNIWKQGQTLYDPYTDMFISVEEYNKLSEREQRNYYTEEQYWDYEAGSYETFFSTYTTKNGEEVCAFGYYGDNY